MKKNTKITILTLLASLFWVVFLWGFWSKGLGAFGFNATFYLFFFVYLVIDTLRRRRVKTRKTLIWLLPLLLIGLSFSLYENPFLKWISFLVVPLIIFIFPFYSIIKKSQFKDQKMHWSLSLVLKLVGLTFGLMKKIDQSGQKMLELFDGVFKTSKNSKKIVQVVLGLIILLFLLGFIIVPLLQSADPIFAQKIEKFSEWLTSIFETTIFLKIIFFLLLSLFNLSLILNWLEKTKKLYSFRGTVFSKTTPKQKDFDPDSIISGIVLSGVSAVYLLFIYTQLERLWVSMLPIDFKQTEELVKSGFWQLFFLSLINISFFFATYNKTKPWVQSILKFFTFASLLLLFSAGQRLFLYVKYYGLSYEKFFAAYTVIYIGLLFIWLIISLFMKKRQDIFKYLIFSCLWMYAIATVLPVEKIIFQSNLALQKLPGSRIEMTQLRMLSSDVLKDVKDYRSKDPDWVDNWQDWVTRREQKKDNKKWFEKNLSNL
ncbi:MAG: DUF4173 domain-containing protein [Candidatus Moranbacteria bacterium]|nr:DUF4173 domain-containing protein [Candidatus Moranbacteria bacterium]